MPNLLLGVHDKEGHGIVPPGGWCLESVSLSQGEAPLDFSSIRRDLNWLVRLNHGYGSTGTLPLPNEYPQFAQRCADYTRGAKGVWGFIIGNEPNHEGERPNNQAILPEDYARAFLLAREAIKRVVPSARVGLAGLAPYHANPLPWPVYLQRVFKALEGKPPPDFLTCHAYTRGMNPDQITSFEEMGGPLANTFSGFLTYRDFASLVPPSLRSLPALITEFDAYGPWEDRATGVITAAYDEVYHWNSQRGNLPKFLALICFRWLGPPEAFNAHDWEMRNKPNLLRDFAEAVMIGYRSPETWIGEGGEELYIPVVTAPEERPREEPQVAVQREIDSRLIERGLTIEEALASPGQSVWRLVKARWFNEQEAGGRHHIYVETLDEEGKPTGGVRWIAVWPSGAHGVFSKPSLGFEASNFPMSPSLTEFSVKVEGGDTVRGIGMGASGNPGHHTSTLLTFQRQRVAAQVPAPGPTSPPPTIYPGRVVLVHPIGEVSLRRVSQRFGANPAYYARFNIEGHNGIDFAVPIGTPIRAAADGLVLEAREATTWGRYVKIRHEFGETLYAHLHGLDVVEGQTVKAGQKIGASGSSGNSTGPHLHFGLRVFPYQRGWPMDGYADPEPYLPVSSGPSLPIPPDAPPPSVDKKALVRIVREAAGVEGLDWRLLVSLVHAESSFNPDSRNPSSGAMGLGQIMPNTWNEWAAKRGVSDPYNPSHNARVAAAYLAWCIEQTGGSVRRGLWAYVWGPTNVRDNPQAVPASVTAYATKILHGAEVADLVL